MPATRGASRRRAATGTLEVGAEGVKEAAGDAGDVEVVVISESIEEVSDGEGER